MPSTTPDMYREEMKIEVLARIDEIAKELSVVRTLAAHYWPVVAVPEPRLVLR